MFNQKLKLAALLISLLALSRETVALCSDGQFLSNGTCLNCTSCGARTVLEQCTNTSDTVCSPNVTSCPERQYLSDGVCKDCTDCENPQLEKCTNVTDTVCAPCSKGYRLNAANGCDFDCDQCSRHSIRSRCNDRQCSCINGYYGIICDIPPASTVSEPTPDPTSNDFEEDSGNRVVLIVIIVVACLVTIMVMSGIILMYYKCSKQPNQDSENSDESTYSSTSINSRTMLTNDHHRSNNSLQQSHQNLNGYVHRTTILPPPQPLNYNIASAIK